MTISREQALDMAQAHAEGLHSPPDGVSREGCPECEDRPLSSYPTHASLAERRELERDREDLRELERDRDDERKGVPDEARRRMLEALAAELRREHPGAIITHPLLDDDDEPQS